MIDYYNNELRDNSKKQLKKMRILYYSLVALYLIFAFCSFFWETTLVYGSKTIWLIRLIFYGVSLVMIFFSFIYVGVKMRRVKKLLRFCKMIDCGIIHENEGTFFEYSESIQENNGVDFKALIFIEWNQYKKDYFERKVLVFYERPFPEFEKEKLYRFTTKGNVLMKYELVEGE